VKAQRAASIGAASTAGSLGPHGAALAVLDALPNAILAVDPSGRITWLNPQVAAVFGYDHAELVGQPVGRLILEDAAGGAAGEAGSNFTDPAIRPLGFGMELRGRRKDGTEFPVEIGLTSVDLPDGPQVVAIVVDITARKLLAQAQLESQKLDSIGRLAGGVAHDFNNVLFAIKGYAELLGDDLGPARRDRMDLDEALQSIEAINEAATRATSLTAQLLAFSQRQSMRPEVLDLDAVVAGIEPAIRPRIGARVQLVVRPGGKAGHVRADRGQLEQILSDLVLNARDAMPDGGTVTVETGSVDLDNGYALTHPEVEPGPHVTVSVSDTGPGMDAGTREHIFEPFFTTKELNRGTGLGLATTYGLVRQAGGHIAVSSEAGVGSTFRLEFPKVDAPETVADAPNPRPAETRAGTILVAEDETAVREVTSVVLRRAGYDVTAVNDGAEALASLATLSIDFLVTDVVMPGMSGIELAERVIDRFPGAGIVLLSGYNLEALDLDRVVRRGALFLTKPVTSSDLLDAVKRSTERRMVADGVT